MRCDASLARGCGIRVLVWGFGLCVMLSHLGCAHVVETRTIELFSKALESGNLDQLKQITSARFEERALRQDAAVDDLKVLRLPTGEVEIVEVDETAPDVKRVTVTVGESKQRMKYQLRLDATTKKWVVDDIYLKQKRDGVTATKSVTEQMDLLLSVREFLDAWRTGSRDDVLNSTTPEFAELLKPLPPTYLNRLTQQVVGKQKLGKRLTPRAQLDDKNAYVNVPIGVGEMQLTFKNLSGHWAVDEIVVTSREEKDAIPSVRQLAQVTHAAVGFLEAYHSHEKESLQEFCTSKFFEGSIVPGNLAQVTLPDASKSSDSIQINIAWNGFTSSDSTEVQQLRGKHADFIVEGAAEVLKLSLVRTDVEDSQAVARYLVEEVTLFDLANQQEKRLSALFTAHAMVQIFSEALAARDLSALKMNSSIDFQRRVWERTQIGTLHEFPLADIEDAPVKIQSTIFSGPVTEVTVTQGSKALTYRLTDRQGMLLIDDVLMPTIGRPSSLKTTLELMLPILDFATGARLVQMEMLQRNSSRDFNRLVWHQTTKIPTIGLDVVPHLHAPLVSIEQHDDQATVVLGDDKFGAHVSLVKESGQYSIDELTLISGAMPRDRVELKRTLRMHLATFGVGKQTRTAESTSSNPLTLPENSRKAMIR